MARFQDLSAELVVGILEEVLPEDIESTSLVSKRIYQLAIPRLEEHRRLRKQYTSFKNMVQNESMSWHDPGGLLADLLCKILSDARIGHYVKILDLELWQFGERAGWKPDGIFENQATTSRARAQQDPKTRMEIIEEAVRATEVIPAGEVDDWLRQIRRGNEDPIVALLFLHAPRLRTLRFVNPYSPSDSSYFLRTIQRVTRQESAVKPYPSHFENVDIWFAEGWESLDFVKAFMSLPSLTSLKTESLFIDGRAHVADSAILAQPSNVTELSFQSSLIPEKAFSELLRGVRNLKTFAYSFTHLWREENFTPPFDSLAVLKSLEDNASHTLESLKLSALNLETSQMTPISGFIALREIELRTSHCLAVEQSSIASLVGVFPVSIERIAMKWHEVSSVGGVEALIEAILGLVRASKTQLPNLRMLQVHTRDQGESDALWDCLASDETAHINARLAFSIQGPTGGGEIPAWVDNVCTCGQDCFGENS